MRVVQCQREGGGEEVYGGAVEADDHIVQGDPDPDENMIFFFQSQESDVSYAGRPLGC